MAILVSVILCTAIFLAISAFRRRHTVHLAMRQYQCAPPRTHWSNDIFFGLDFTIEMHTNLEMTKRNHNRFGLTYQLDSLYGNTIINTIAPENLPRIYSNKKDFGIQPRRLPAMEYFCGRGFLTTDGSTWLQARKTLRPSFAKQNISQLDFLSRETRQLLEKLPADGATIDLEPLLFITFLNSSLHFLLGIDPSQGTDHAPYTPEQFIESFHSALFGTGRRIMLGRFKGLAPKAAYVDACTRTHEYIDFYIKEALKDSSLKQEPLETHGSPYKQRSVIQGLAAQTDDMYFIRSQIVQGMLASQETISVLVSNTMFLMARHPEEWKQLRTDVLRHGEDLFNFHNLSSFRPIQNVLNEALRLYPVFPLLGRTCLQNTTLPVGGGQNQDQPIYVPKGAFVMTSFLTLHMDEKVFGKHPELFSPARWNDIRPAQWEYMPFGGGDRACLGKEKVLAEAAYVVARLAQTFARIEARDDRPWKGLVKLTAKNAHGCKVGLFRE